MKHSNLKASSFFQKLHPPILFFFLIGFMLFSWAYLPIAKVITYPINLMGILGVLLGIALSMYGSKLFEHVETNIYTFRDPDKLVVTGPFKYSRNPMYLGFVLSLLGVALLLGNLVSFILVGLFFIAANYWYIPFEESAMQSQFGEQYLNYKQNVRRWI